MRCSGAAFPPWPPPSSPEWERGAAFLSSGLLALVGAGLGVFARRSLPGAAAAVFCGCILLLFALAILALFLFRGVC